MRKILYVSFAASLLLVGCNSATEPAGEVTPPPTETPVEEVPEETATLPEREPTMEVVQSLEGEESTVMMELVEGNESLYSLYIDPGHYVFETNDKEDILKPIENVPEGYPEVSMSFILVDNQTPDSVKQDMQQEYSMPLNEKNIKSPVNALSLHGTSGEDPDSEVVTLYMVEVDQGTLLITEKYFLEAQEGHGARFEQMLETLEVRK